MQTNLWKTPIQRKMGISKFLNRLEDLLLITQKPLIKFKNKRLIPT